MPSACCCGLLLQIAIVGSATSAWAQVSAASRTCAAHAACCFVFVFTLPYQVIAACSTCAAHGAALHTHMRCAALCSTCAAHDAAWPYQASYHACACTASTILRYCLPPTGAAVSCWRKTVQVLRSCVATTMLLLSVTLNGSCVSSQVFHGIPFKPGDVILTSVAEYGSNYLAFLQVSLSPFICPCWQALQ